MKKVILFGGSFNPVHNGHLTIAKMALKQRGAHEVWFIPTKMSPFKADTIAFEHRYNMLLLATKANSAFRVLDIENTMPEPSYSIDTVQALQAQYPDYTFEWLLGSDQLPRLSEWKSFAKLDGLVDFIVYARTLDPIITDYPVLSGIVYDVSSTAIRQGLSTQTHPQVLHYMMTHCLYLNTMLQTHLSSKRSDHVQRVSALARALAIQHGLDLERVELAAKMHDLCKEDDRLHLERLMKTCYPKWAALDPEIHHAFAAAHVLSHHYYIKDKAVLNAIRNHVQGDAHHPIAMVVYIADKCEIGRPYDTKPFIDLAMRDLTQGFAAVKKHALDYLKSKGIKV